MTPQSLNVIGATQPEIYQGTVDAIVQELLTNAATYWQDALVNDGPLEIWEIHGERWLYNGTHRYHAAVQAGVEIPDDHVKIVAMTGSAIPKWRFDQMTWLPGVR